MCWGNRRNQRIKVNRPEFDFRALSTLGPKRERIQLEKYIIRDDILWATIVHEAELSMRNIGLHKYRLLI